MNTQNFNAIVFTGDTSVGNQGFITYHKQTSLERLKNHFNSVFPLWRFVTIYDRKTNEKEVIKNIQDSKKKQECFFEKGSSLDRSSVPGAVLFFILFLLFASF